MPHWTKRVGAALVSRELLVVLAAVGAALRVLQYASDRSLWLDESFLAINLLDKSFAGIFGQLDFAQGAPPGFLAVERLAAAALGYSEYALRLFPLLAGLAALVAFVPLARRVLTPSAVPLAVAFFSLANGLVYYSSELKPYSVDVSATVVIMLAAAMLADDPESRRPAIAFAASLTALLFSFAAAFAAVAAVALLVARALRARHLPRPLAIALVVWIAGMGALGVFAASRLSVVRHAFSLSATGSVGSARSTLQTLNVFGTNLAAATGFLQSAPWAEIEKVGIVVVAVGTIRLLVRRRLAGSIVVLTLLLAAGAVALRLYPVTERTAVFLVPVAALLLAEGAAAALIPRAFAASALFATVCVVLLAGPVWLAAKGAVQPREHEELRPVLADVRDSWRPGDALYIDYAAQYAFYYYMRCGCFSADGQSGQPLWPVAPAAAGTQEFAPALRSLSPSVVVAPEGNGPTMTAHALDPLRHRRRIWFIFSHVSSDQELRAITTNVLGALDRLGTRLRVDARDGAYAYLYRTDG